MKVRVQVHEVVIEAGQEHPIGYQFIFVTLEMYNSLSEEVSKIVRLLGEKTVNHMSTTRRKLLTISCQTQNIFSQDDCPRKQFMTNLIQTNFRWIWVRGGVLKSTNEFGKFGWRGYVGTIWTILFTKVEEGLKTPIFSIGTLPMIGNSENLSKLLKGQDKFEILDPKPSDKE